MTLFEEFKQSLKAIEAEEVFDLVIYRPIAFIFVKLVYSTNLTPNQISVIAMIAGISAGVAFGFGTTSAFTIGALLYLAGNILDCADGQVARLKKNGTKVGRIVDGSIDYTVSIAVFLGIAIGLSRQESMGTFNMFGNYFNGNAYAYIWITTALAGFSSAIQAFYFDFYRNKFLEIVYGKVYSLEDEIKEFEEEKERIIKEPDKAGLFDKLLISVYLKYTKLQLKSQMKRKSYSDENIPAEWFYSKNKILLRILSFTGSTTHITLCIICALANNLELFILLCIIPLNIIMLIIYFIQRRVYNNLLIKVKSKQE